MGAHVDWTSDDDAGWIYASALAGASLCVFAWATAYEYLFVRAQRREQ